MFLRQTFSKNAVTVVNQDAGTARMIITEKMVQAIMNNLASDLPAEQLAIVLPKKIVQVDTIHNQLLAIRRKSDEIREAYNKQQADLQAEIERIRTTCPHYVPEFHSDPSGNGDSYYDCSVCGKII